MSMFNSARGGGEHLSPAAGYSAVFCLLGLIAGGGAVYVAADHASGSLALSLAACAVFALLLSRVLWAIRLPAQRTPRDADGGGDGGSKVPRDPAGPSGPHDGVVDWERFEREFRSYARRYELVGRAR